MILFICERLYRYLTKIFTLKSAIHMNISCGIHTVRQTHKNENILMLIHAESANSGPLDMLKKEYKKSKTKTHM